MHVSLKLFAAVRENLNTSRLEIELPAGATGADVRAALVERYPGWRDLVSACRLARGIDFIEDTALLAEGDEVVLIPPVSGGNAFPSVLLTTDPLDVTALRAEAGVAAAGAVVVFEGTVRSPSGGRVVTHLEYEAYEPMALAQMEHIVNAVRAESEAKVVLLHHRLGRVEVGEASVVAVASAPHRGQAFAACRELIERLKADVPIWKKEFFADGSMWVGAPGECQHPPPLEPS